MQRAVAMMAMMAMKGIYAKYLPRSLNHGIGFNTAAIELLLPTYGEELGLKGKACLHWLLNPHPTMIPAIESRKDKMREAALRGFSTATDLADYLVRKGIAFRDSHEIVGKSVAYGIETGKDLGEMTLEELQQFSDTITDDVFEVLTLEGSVSARDHIGGTAPDQVRAAVQRGRAVLAARG